MRFLLFYLSGKYITKVMTLFYLHRNKHSFMAKLHYEKISAFFDNGNDGRNDFLYVHDDS